MCLSRIDEAPEVALEDFTLKSQIGKGTFGRIFLAELPYSDKQYAIKAIRKDVLIDTGQIQSTLLEQEILMKFSYPFLCNMEYFF